MTAETKEYAQLAARVYTTTPRNKLESPPGWETLELIPDLSDGFSAGVFRRIGTNEIVIAYTGTNANKVTDTAFGNFPAATGQPSSQVLKAMLLYERVKNTPGYGDNISFTGHSLGGGLASLMAVYFNKYATTFDAAPFQLSALNSATLNYYKNEMASRGYVDGNFNQYNDATYPLPPSTFSAREASVKGYHLQGEFLNPTRNDLTTIYGGAENEIPTGPTALSAFQLHSMVLLSATQWSTGFASAIQANAAVLTMVFDKTLYFKDDETDQQANFLNLALNSEVKTTDTGSQGMLTHFAIDLGKLGTNIAGLNAAAQDAIIAQGIEWYYWQGTDYAGQEFFTQTGELLQYTTAQGDGLEGALNKAFPYVSKWLDPIVQASGGDIAIYDYDQWNIAAGSGGSTATARNAEKTQIFIGGDGADTFTGGDKVDTILAGSGADTLNGGSGGDRLHGGAGNDTYQLTSGELFDVITDSDGNGTLWVDGLQLTGGRQAADDYWISDDRQWGFSLAGGGDLIISKGSSPDTITIRNWQTNGGDKLGIILDDAPATTPTATNTFIGDFTKLKNEEGTAYLLGSDGNYQGDGAQPGAPDVLNGTSGADAMRGLDGNDGIAGLDGDDLIEGGAGDDLLLGGQGADTIKGGDGSDEILGSANGMIAHPGSVNFTPPAASGTELSRGFSWVIYVPTNDDNYVIDGGGDIFSNGETKGNVIDGGAGDDRIGAGSGADIAHGGEGNDIVTGMGAGDVLFGDAGNDFVMGDGHQGANAWHAAFAEHGADVIDGGAGNDTLRGQGGDDVMYGGTEDDQIWGDDNDSARTPGNNHGNDYLDGEDGSDMLVGGGREDVLFGGGGNDQLAGDHSLLAVQYHGDDYLDGEGGDDSLVGNGGNDVLLGGDGKDTLYGDDSMQDENQTGDDYLDGGAGDDLLLGQGGKDQLEGSEGKDELQGGDGDDTLWGGADDDRLFGHAGADVADGGGGNDQMTGGIGSDTMSGVAGNDVLVGGDGDDLLLGGNDHDVLVGDAGADTAFGDAGNDELQGGGEADSLSGGGDDDLLFGQSGDDTLNGDDGNDELVGGDGDDLLMGGGDHDLLVGEAGVDTLFGDAGNDELQGGDGNDTLNGGEDNDVLFGGAGTDTLEGGAGKDILQGDSGSNTYKFGRGGGQDAIVNFDAASVDTLEFAADVLASDVYVSRNGNDQVYSIKGTNDSITIKNYHVVTGSIYSPYYGYTYYYDYRVEQVSFSDGTIWTPTMTPLYFAGSSGADSVTATAYNDTFGNSTASDTFYGGQGSDTYMFGLRSGKDTISDQMVGADTNTVLISSGLTTSDLVINRNASGDLVLGIENSPDTLTVLGGTNTSYAVNIKFESDGTIWTPAFINQQLPTATDQADQLWGSSLDDTINGAGGNDVIIGGAGNDSVDGGLNNDSIEGSDGNDLLYGGIGNDSLYGGAGNDSSDGGDGNDYIDGGSNDDYLSGGSGDDILHGGQYNDTLDGGAGNDLLYGDGQSVENSSDTYLFDIGSGFDTIIDLNGVYSSPLSVVRLGSGFSSTTIVAMRIGNDLVLRSPDGTDQLTVQDQYLLSYSTGVRSSMASIIFADGTTWDQATMASFPMGPASNGPDVLSGTDGSDSISGLGGNDALHGYAGNDWLDGGPGDDTLIGGAGDDTHLVDSALDVVIENANDGTDTVQSSVAYTLSGEVENLTLTGFAASIGTGNALNNTLIGNSAINTLVGGAGDDTLDGATGGNSLIGGTGNDTYIVRYTFDTVTENANEGIDTVQSTVSNTLSGNVENLTLTDTSAINGTGNALDNMLVGNGAANTLTGGAGNDTLDGGAGIDTLIGGTGNDTYLIESSSDVLTENAGEGTDTVASGVSYTLATNFENLTLTGTGALTGTGNALDNLLAGNSRDNVLNGGTGIDTLVGGAGHDIYVVDGGTDVIIENANEGTDLAQSSAGYTLSVNVENLTLTGTGAINGTGNNLNNILTGNSGSNVLTGGMGDDTYVVAAGDTVIENANEGIDTVQSAATYTLGANVERLTLTGTARIDGSGSGLDNLIIGNSANNVLTGGAGDDRLEGGGGTDKLIGGTGNDYYVIDDSRDAITENANEGIDTVQTAFTYTLAVNLESLTLVAGLAINGTGNAVNNIITGNALGNILSGAAGSDTLIGGDGNDTYIVDNVNDAILENAAEGMDLVQSAVTYTLFVNVENLALTGTAAINGTGNSLGNTLTGNSAANVLIGGAGDDTYVVGAGDSVVESLNEGTDTVLSAVTYTLGANIENLTLTGTSAINGTGNSSNNVLTGNSGNNVLAGGAGDDTYVIATGDSVIEAATEGSDTVQSTATHTLGANVENLTLMGASAVNGTGNGLNNILIGNSAANVLSGGAGDDTYWVSTGDSVVEAANGGTDAVQSSVTFTLGVNIENLVLNGISAINGIGNGLNNVLIGNGANNRLDGGAGADTMSGGLGDDTYVVDSAADVVIENANEGIDTMHSYMSYVSGGNIENITLLGTVAINASGDATNNVLTGNSAANVLTGAAGNDTLNGGGGSDTLIGGTGDDTYVVSGAGALIFENTDEGTDTVQSSVSYALDANVESLTLIGSTALNGSGNGLGNVVTGNDGNNVLDGGAGSDKLYGGLGNDTLYGTGGDELLRVPVNSA